MPLLTDDQPFERLTELADGSIEIELDAEEAPGEQDFYANLADGELSAFTLNQLASDLEELIERDKTARKKRDEQYEEGLRRTGLGNDAPGGATFDGASKVVHPVMAEGCVDFAARAMKEIFPAKGPVKTAIKDANDQKLRKAKQKRDYLNNLLTTKIEEYRPEKEQLLTQLPLGGSQYEKFWHDREVKRIRMEFVPVDKVLLPFATTSFYTAPRITHIQELTQRTFEQRVRSGFYIDVNSLLTDTEPEGTAAQTANDKIEGRTASGYNEDGLRVVYEVTCWWRLEDEAEDAAPKPYVISLDDSTGKILAVYRNWAEDDELCRKLDWWVEDIFIPWRGAYGIGLPHLIGGLTAALTGALRALLDAAHINNMPSMLKLKAGRIVGQNLSIDVTQVTEIEGPAGVSDIRQLAMPLPFNPPSPVLVQLLDWLTGAAKGVVATAEEKIADASNQMPVGTALALIEQGSQIFSSIHARLHESQRRALRIVCRLTKDFATEEELAAYELTREDFDDADDVQPVSDPNIFSEAQRYAQLQETLKVKALFPNLRWNDDALARQALELLRVEDIDSKLPAVPEPISGNPLVENAAAMKSVPLKISEGQDHLAHAMCHVQFLLSPFGAQNPLTPPAGLAQVLGHAQEHLNAYYVMQAQAAMVTAAVQLGAMGAVEGVNEDNTAVAAQQLLVQSAPAEVQQLMQLIPQAVQLVQQRQPQPPMPPEVQASLQIADMETKRKAALDQATLGAKAAEQQATQAVEAQKLSLASMQQEFERQLAHMEQMLKAQQEESRLQLELQKTSYAQQVELLKNEQDNHQHQLTELIKNQQDNQTEVLIARLKAAVEAAKPPEVSGETDATRLVEEVRGLMEEYKAQQGAEQMQALMVGLHSIAQHLARPKRLVRDANGDAVGIE